MLTEARSGTRGIFFVEYRTPWRRKVNLPFDSNLFVHIEPSSSNRLSCLSTRVLLGGVTPKCELPKFIEIATSQIAPNVGQS